ncbi:hypothetical protein GDO78_013289 [Eleutherodactylus coqui]|uniref:Uncharacterized protein n=1 Tax=Eleutherodactylus coqui TaxID=57060 RepID=A0A8J6EY24_ELECQ|nr:hypothetical protein GDO78_013289 [Eleutherodactylus coqui]
MSADEEQAKLPRMGCIENICSDFLTFLQIIPLSILQIPHLTMIIYTEAQHEVIYQLEVKDNRLLRVHYWADFNKHTQGPNPNSDDENFQFIRLPKNKNIGTGRSQLLCQMRALRTLRGDNTALCTVDVPTCLFYM